VMASTTCPLNGHDRSFISGAISAGDVAKPAPTLRTIRAVSAASKPMIAVTVISVDQVNSRLAGFGAAIAQWPNVFADEANEKLNDHHEIVNGRQGCRAG